MKTVRVVGSRLEVLGIFRKISLEKKNISRLFISKIPSLFDEIAITIETNAKHSKCIVISERINGFFQLEDFLNLKERFGDLWYRKAEDGCRLEASIGIASEDAMDV